MTTITKQDQFLAACADTSKTYRLEAFSFTHDVGVNIYFDDYEDLAEIVKGVEIEFWLVEDTINDVEIKVSSFASLRQVMSFFEEIESGDEDLIEAYANLVDCNFCSWGDVKDWHANNYVTDYESDADFGHYLIDECDCLEIPEAIQGYFDYEAYGRDMLASYYAKCEGRIYHNS